jgi:hypothetical protein
MVCEPVSFCVLQLRALCVAPGLPDGASSNSRLRGIRAVIVFEPYTLEMLSLVVEFALVEKATVFFLSLVRGNHALCAVPCSPLCHHIAHGELDAHTDASICIQQLQDLVVFSLYILLQLLPPDGQIVE